MNVQDHDKKICVIAGAGLGSGESFARKFAAAGYQVILLSRSTEFCQDLSQQLDDVHALVCDLTKSEEISQTFAYIEQHFGAVDTLIYNPGKAVFGNIETISSEAFEAAWRLNVDGLFHTARAVLRGMKTTGHGNLIVMGASASRRGLATSAAFASAKMGQKALTESMARHLWPAGIHVCLVVIDGVIQSAAARERLPMRQAEDFVDPAAIADSVFHLCQQNPSTWSFEIELRPAKEHW